jgi:arginyl-tRNA synthetase
VALTPRCANELGYELNAEETARPWVDVSGRKGRGVKADDLIDQLEASARGEVDARHPEMPEADRAAIAHAIAIGALRFYLLKYTRNTIIAFDFKDALSFEGETGPYAQYAVVRIRNIFRKLWAQQAPPGHTPADVSTANWLSNAPPDAAPYLAAGHSDDIWELLLLAGSLESYIDKALGAQEPSFVARCAFQLAQAFNLFYQKHHILSEEDTTKKAFLLHLSALIERQLVAALDLLGIEAPEKM